MPTSIEQRPDPDQLLAKVKHEEAQARRGKLRIYFGSSAGVGKTYAMLVAARKLRAEGRDVVLGVIETHGRSETAALLEDLEILPPKVMLHRGKQLTEFDLDGALQRRPSLILVDELAHSNIPGARHPKRWQDIEELLAAGIDVFSTLNVQHLESLNDVVGGITNVRVWETVPDTFFDEAEEVVLVDIPADELLARLKAGKVYVQQQAERAANNFFRKGNLMALRELALRRTADRVEGDVQAYRVGKAIAPVWKTATALLTCVGPDAGAVRVVRAAARLASQLNADWHAIYVETPALQRRPPAQRERILATLNLAKELGGTTAVIANSNVAESVVAYARKHNLSKVVIAAIPGSAARAARARHRFGRDRAHQGWRGAGGQSWGESGGGRRGDVGAGIRAATQGQTPALCLGGARLRVGDAACRRAEPTLRSRQHRRGLPAYSRCHRLAFRAGTGRLGRISQCRLL
jgi:two-component system sensor histidine kinase KdpD